MAIPIPRIQTIVILIICVILVAGTAYYASPPPNSDSSILSVSSISKNNVDTSNPIIDIGTSLDWKKQFASTTKLGSTIKSGSGIKTEPLTNTDALSQEFFAQYINLKQANLLGNQDIVNQTTENLITSHFDTTPQKIYTINDIHIISATDKNTLNIFAMVVTRVINSYNIKKGEADIVEEYLTNNDPAVLADIDVIITTYKRLISDLLKIPSPHIFANQEIDLINAFGMLEFSARNLRVMNADPIAGLSGVGSHTNGAVQLVNALKNMYDTLKAKDIEFDFNQEILNTLLK